MNNLTKLLLLSILAIATLTHCDREDPEITDFAYPPEEMLRYFDFPEGSWWAYLCINDSTVDTFRLIHRNAPGRLKKDRYSDGAYYKGAGFQYKHISQNKIIELDTFSYSISPFGYINPNKENEHYLFYSWMTPFKGQFNPHEEMYFPIGDSNYSYLELKTRIIYDSNIQEFHFDQILLLQDIWQSSTISPFITDKFFVEDIGIVKYTLSNDYTYELIQYSIN